MRACPGRGVCPVPCEPRWAHVTTWWLQDPPVAVGGPVPVFSDEKPGTDHARLDAPRSGATPAPGRFLRWPSTTLFSRGGHKVPGNVETSSKPQRDSAAAAGDRHGAHRSATPRPRSRRLSSAPCPLSPEKRRPASVSSDGAWWCRSSARAAWGPGRATSASLIGGPRSLRRARV